MKYIVSPGGKVNGDIRVPGDKSMSHRSIMLGSIAEGTTVVDGFLRGEDALATLKAFRAMGVEINTESSGRIIVNGVGLNGLQQTAKAIDLGNSGTSIRLMSGLLSGQSFSSTLVGDTSLNKRPMGRVVTPLTKMGALINTGENGRPPLVISPNNNGLQGISYKLPMASAQVKSCVLLAGLYADGTTDVLEPAPTRDHTERMLRGFGYDVITDGPKASLVGGGKLTACEIDVPADISSAAFFLVAASICPGADLILRHVGMNPTRIGIINILLAMGGDIELLDERQVGGEPVADLRVRHAQLQGVHFDESQVPLAIDEFPVLFVAAACAEGETVLTGAEELRVKESDRIQVMADGLRSLGVDAEPTEDGMIIQGGPITGGQVDSHHDHRIAMSFAVAALRATGNIEITGADTVATSFPGFADLANSVGMQIKEETTA